MPIIDWDGDVMPFRDAYQARSGDANYVPGFDFNNDGKIDYLDIAPLSWMYGLTRDNLSRMDMDGDGIVTQADYDMLNNHINPPASPAAAANNELLQRKDVEVTVVSQFSDHFSGE